MKWMGKKNVRPSVLIILKKVVLGRGEFGWMFFWRVLCRRIDFLLLLLLG